MRTPSGSSRARGVNDTTHPHPDDNRPRFRETQGFWSARGGGGGSFIFSERSNPANLQKIRLVHICFAASEKIGQ